MDLRLGPNFELRKGLSGGDYYLGPDFELRRAAGPVAGSTNPVISYEIVCDSGVFNLTGSSATFGIAYTLTAQSGLFTLTGSSAGLGQIIGSIDLAAITSRVSLVSQTAYAYLLSLFNGIGIMETTATCETAETLSRVAMVELGASVQMEVLQSEAGLE